MIPPPAYQGGTRRTTGKAALINAVMGSGARHRWAQTGGGMLKTTNQRLVALCAGFLLLFALLWGRCAWLQVIGAGRLAKLARAQHRVSRSMPPQRGTIYDRNGQILAMSVPVPSVFANPRQMVAKDQAAMRLASLLGRDPHMMNQRLARDKGFVWLARQVDPDLKEQLRPFRREGIGLAEEPKRLFPHGNMAAHLLGDVDIDEKGLEGLERVFDGVLRGRPGWQSTYRDAKGDLLIGPWTIEVEPQAGCDVVLTIDSVVQGIAEEALASGVAKAHAKGGSLIVMDPHTGQILALANQPSFDPNHPGRAPAEARRNRAVTDLAEPGSVFKIVTASALLEEGLVQPEEQFFCEEGAYHTVGHHVLHDHQPHGWLTFHDVIRYSSNIGTAKAAQRLKPETLYRYIRAFGFGQKTGIELPGEVSGIVPPPSKWSKLSPFAIPIGQEVAVTPIQLAGMVAIVANGGWTVRPYLVAGVQRPDGEPIRRYEGHPRKRLLRPETVEQLHAILISVVESGTGRLANVQDLTVAGKTGTAQKLEPSGHYSHSLFVASFVGYGPVPGPLPYRVAEGDPRSVTEGAASRHGDRWRDDPRFVMVVTVDEPRPVYFGGVVAAPIFRRVVEQLASYWDLRRSPEAQTVARLP